MRFSKLSFILAVALASPLFAADWTVDAAHSAINFKVRHMMISNVSGKFKDYKASLVTDDKDKLTAAEATIEAKSIDTADQKRDDHLRGADFFNVETNPAITFKSKKMVAGKKGLKIVGDLTMHGVTKEVTFDGSLTPAIKDPFGNNRRALSAKATLNRKDFGIVWNKSMDGGGLVVGETVDVDLELEFTAAKKEATTKS